jgi:tRNA(Ile)-lysidine synthase
VLLAVSGGADSTALLLGSVRSAARLRLRLEVACLNHGLRPGAESEVNRVRELSKEHGLAFHTRSLALAEGAGIEARARKARYEALESIRSEASLDLIATAHTASDQAETLLMRLARGSSARGAAAILERRGRIIRPLLGFARHDVESFLASLGASFASDPMNEDPSFFRTRVRREALPALVRAAGKGSLHALARFARFQAEDAALLDGLAEQAYERLRVGPTSLDAVGVRALLPPLQRRVLARLLGEQGLQADSATLDKAVSALASGRGAPVGRRCSLRTESGVVRVVSPQPHRVEPPLELREGWNEDSVSGLRIAVLGEKPSPPPRFWIEVRTASLPMFLRRRFPGDWVIGSSGRRKLQDLLVDQGVQSELRDVIPIICDAKGMILWVVGVWPRRPAAEVGSEQNVLSTQRWYLSAEFSTGGGGAWIGSSL